MRVVGVVAVLVLAGALLPVLTKSPSREIVLVAKGMAFYLEDDPGKRANPTIDVRAGEQVRIILRNEDRGFTHDFAVPALDTALKAINWNQTSGVVLEAPSTPGTYDYVCRPHSLMMRGTLRVIGES